MASFSGLYIDTVYISNLIEDLSGLGVQNVLETTENKSFDINTNQGYQWVIQIVNGSGGTISGDYELLVQTHYLNSENTVSTTPLTNIISFTLNNLANNSSYYIGSSGIINLPLININDQSDLILADQKSEFGTILAAASFRLSDNSALPSTIDTVPNFNVVQEGDITSDRSIVYSMVPTQSTLDNPTVLTRNTTSGLRPNQGTYNSNNWIIDNTLSDLQSRMQGSAFGDPHIKTFSGESYKFDYLGAFRLFESFENDNTIVVNGFSERGPRRWKKRQYIKKIFIKCNDKSIYVDLGFRGTPVQIIENNGFNYIETQLEFNKDAERYCFKPKSTYSTKNLDEPVTEDLPALIRNEIKIQTNLFSIILQNVNEYNLQPCRIALNIPSKSPKGCMVDRKYAFSSKLDDIKDTKKIEYELKNIPDTEIEPSKIKVEYS